MADAQSRNGFGAALPTAQTRIFPNRMSRIKYSKSKTRQETKRALGIPRALVGFSNHPGEIAWLSDIARPTVAVITQCAPAHLEGFGSVAGIAHAKSEIFEGLAEDGTAIVNADDDYASLWRNKGGVKTVQKLLDLLIVI